MKTFTNVCFVSVKELEIKKTENKIENKCKLFLIESIIKK